MLETFIIMGIITPIKSYFSSIRHELFKNIIPNLDLDLETYSKIHFIYNEDN